MHGVDGHAGRIGAAAFSATGAGAQGAANCGIEGSGIGRGCVNCGIEGCVLRVGGIDREFASVCDANSQREGVRRVCVG